jgi:hydrogenase maturation protein HypF
MRAGRHIEVRGVVQGVGFRPWVYRLATEFGLTGRVSNGADGVAIDVHGEDDHIAMFLEELEHEPPPAARIDELFAERLPFRAFDGFVIEESRTGDVRRLSVPAELATCDECLREIDDPLNRRFQYAFTNCTNCGPRYSIVTDIPYDRDATTMRRFEMCVDCRREYESPADRRFHAEPNACPACGPRLSALSHDGTILHVNDPLAFTIRALGAGFTAAIKGLGGFHLACDATSETAVSRLRTRKRREAKPFAVMAAGIEEAEAIAVISEKEKALLISVERPIVLLRKRNGSALAKSVAPDNDLIGVMLPYTPLHHLLLAGAKRPLVMTSGNISDEPMVTQNDRALRALGDVADVFLTHDREIANRVDDSVARVIADGPVILRRARGFVPRGIRVARPFSQPILACGAHLKNTFCLATGSTVFLGPHIGDLDALETIHDYKESIDTAKSLLGIEPQVIAHDRHPGYYSTRYALTEPRATTIAVQHHHAHIAAAIGEHNLDGPVIGLAWDGTGYGDDGTSWGGEFFIATRAQFERVATFRPIRLAGGDRAVRDIWRLAVAALEDAGEDPDLFNFPSVRHTEIAAVRQMLATGLNVPLSHGVGRWFDAFGSLFLERSEARYEGEVAMAWNSVADPLEKGSYPFSIGQDTTPWQIDMRLVLVSALQDLRRGMGASKISARFHNTLTRIALEVTAEMLATTGDLPIVLGGGCFQNSLLTEGIIRGIGESRRVYFNRAVPPGDGGIAFGQAIVADAILRRNAALSPTFASVVSGGS